MKQHIPTIGFIVLAVLGGYFSRLSPTFIVNEVMIRLIRDGILVLALIIPIRAGLGLNFAITIGAIAAQIGWLLVLDMQWGGGAGIAVAAAFGCGLSTLFGWMIGKILNRAKGREMVATMIMGFIGTSVYQFIFLVGYGGFIPCHNPEIILSRGIGVRSMVDLHAYRNILDRYGVIQFGSLEIPLGMMNVYTGHLNSDLFSIAALLAGGATVKNASIRNAMIGIVLFHSLFIVSPQAGQNLFRNAAIGEYFRTFVAYGTIVFALMANARPK